MKTIIFIVSVVLAGSAITSCKKEYKCKCTKTYTTSTTTYTSDDGNYIYKDTKPRAINRCNDNDETGSDLGGDYSRNCDIE